jgi:integrase/recombinase XerD
MREIIARLGQAAKLSSLLGPHDLRHTFAKSLLDPAADGLNRPPMPLLAIRQLLGHADIATTTIYARVSADDLARMMGMPESCGEKTVPHFLLCGSEVSSLTQGLFGCIM